MWVGPGLCQTRRPGASWLFHLPVPIGSLWFGLGQHSHQQSQTSDSWPSIYSKAQINGEAKRSCQDWNAVWSLHPPRLQSTLVRQLTVSDFGIVLTWPRIYTDIFFTINKTYTNSIFINSSITQCYNIFQNLPTLTEECKRYIYI